MSGPTHKIRKAPPPSQEKVKCFWCNHEGRKDNLKKHHDLKHPGKELKWKHILPDGQSSLFKLFPGRANSIVPETQPPSAEECHPSSHLSDLGVFGGTSADVAEESYDAETLNNDDTTETPRKRFCSGDFKSAGASGGNSGGRDIADNENNHEKTVSGGAIEGIVKDLKDVVSSMSDLKNNFTDMVARFTEKLVVSEKEASEDSRKSESLEIEPIIDSSAVFNSKDLYQLLKILPDRGFDFDEEIGLVTCVLCNQSSAPNARLRDKKVGIFSFNLDLYMSEVELEPKKQPRMFINLKASLVKHERESQIHLSLKEKSVLEKKEGDLRQSRNEKIGHNLFKIRYNGIMHGSSYLNFEEDVLTAHLTGADTGDINNGCDFARDLTENIVGVMKKKLAHEISKPLDATKKKRPVGFVADKITPNKRTGHIAALILPVPENPLPQPFLNPVMLDLPPVADHTAEGLSDQMLELMRGAGVADSQLEGVGVDGQYIKLGAIKKMIAKLNVDGLTEEQLLDWVFETWEPAHNLNKADEEIRKLQIFEWLVRFTKEVGEITGILGIGKGLEQSKHSASELGKRLYKLQAYSVTRFAAHVEKTFKNTYKSFEIIIKTLETRAESKDKKVSDVAKDLLTKLLSTKFVGTLLGCIDIYRVIATASCDLQTVEQFPWEVVANLNSVVTKLKKMSETLKIVNSDSNGNVTGEQTIEVDENEWPHLARHLNDLKSGKFKNLAVGSGAARRAGRIRSYFGHENDLLTVQNRLTTLCKYEAKHIATRTVNNQEHPYPPIISSMEGCFDIQKMISASTEEEFDISFYGIDCLEKVLKQASYKSEEADQVKSEYLLLKKRLFDLLFNKDSPNRHFFKQYEHIIYKTHTCSDKCQVHVYKKCPNYMKILQPKLIISMKVLHLLLKFSELYEGLSGVLHLFLRCATKTHAEGVAESMGNYVDFYSDKKRGLDIVAVGEESYIHWNGPPVHLAGALGAASLDRKFGGRSNWRFVTKKGRGESLVVTRLKRNVARVPFFQ